MHQQEMEQYIVSHLDEALENGWIQLYLQPFVRTITDEYSGAEALARWIDPTFGMIMPNTFVPVLERAGLIFKVDCFMLTETLRLQKKRSSAGLPVTLISVNLSRQDFEKMDMVGFIQKQVDSFGIQKDLIALELTESLLVQNKERMVRVVEQLRAAGFQVWMDDFGSGYSSLIFLNDYTLDLIKLDMGFLNSFTQTSRVIMRSAVDMAKKLKIRTLAEGVEKEEHVRFLKEIGCDMMQGYFYAVPFSTGEGELKNDLKRTALRYEASEWKKFYDMADTCVVDSDSPRAVMEYHIAEDRIHYLFLNSSEKEELRSLGRTAAADSEFILNARNNPLHTKILEYVKYAIHSGETVTMYVPDNSRIVRTSGRMIARREDRCIFQGSIVNVTEDRLQKIGEKIDQTLSDIVLLFDDVHVLDPEKDTADNMINNFGIDAGLTSQDRLRRGIHHFCDDLVHPEDRDRYWEFSNPDTMIRRLLKTPGGSLQAYFRVLLPSDGGGRSYQWKEFNLLMIPGSDNKKVLSCIKSADPAALMEACAG